MKGEWVEPEKPEGVPEDGMGGEQPPEATPESVEQYVDDLADSAPEKGFEFYIAEAKNSEDLKRLAAEINHRHDDKKINTAKWGKLSQLVHDRSKEIAKGGGKKGKTK